MEIVEPSHPLWKEVTYQIRTRYKHAFGAVLCSFMPTFLVMMKGQRIISICGFQSAKYKPLFSEQYLSNSANAILSGIYGETVDRSKLVEFGQLSLFTKGTSPLHFYMIAEFLVEQGYEWAIFTATDPLHALMSKLGLKLEVIDRADKSQIPNADKIWGSYYQTSPRIVAGNIREGLEHLHAIFAEKKCCLGRS
nr:thermostable hemolysin [Vibrio sinus]